MSNIVLVAHDTDSFGPIRVALTEAGHRCILLTDGKEAKALLAREALDVLAVRHLVRKSDALS